MTKENVKSAENQVAALTEANRELKERLVDSMEGEVQARRKLEQVRQYAGQLEQEMQKNPPMDAHEPAKAEESA